MLEQSQHRGYVVHEGCDHLFFVGFLGAGKSTLARNLGCMFRREFVDTDKLVERSLGMSVCEVFEHKGEDYFRAAEVRVLEQLKLRKSLLVSCGGGIVENPQSLSLMHEMGTIVYLDGDLSDSLRQIRHPEIRPDFKTIRDAERCYKQRLPLYQKHSDLKIDIRGKSFEEVCNVAAELLWEKGLL